MQREEASLIIPSNTENSTTNENFNNIQEAQTSLIIPDSRNTEDDDDEECNVNSTNVIIAEKQSIVTPQNKNQIFLDECKRLVKSFGFQYTNSFRAKGELQDCKFTILKYLFLSFLKFCIDF